MTDIAGMVKAGAKAISEDGKSVMNAEIYREAMKEAKKREFRCLPIVKIKTW